MNIIWITGSVLFGSYLLYKEFFPVDANCINISDVDRDEETMIIDLRDYNISAKYPIKEAFVLPFAYLKRYHHQFQGKKLYIIAPNYVVRNKSIRFLKGKGYQVLGYCIIREGNQSTNEIIFKKCS